MKYFFEFVGRKFVILLLFNSEIHSNLIFSKCLANLYISKYEYRIYTCIVCSNAFAILVRPGNVDILILECMSIVHAWIFFQKCPFLLHFALGRFVANMIIEKCLEFSEPIILRVFFDGYSTVIGRQGVSRGSN